MFLIPSSPAARQSARTRYGLAVGSGFLNSTLVPFPLDAGILISGLLFFADHAIYTGASYPGTSLLYELTSGLVIADIPLACFIIPAIK